MLTDLGMPGMDGMTLMQRIWEREPTRPVVVMTGHASIDTAVEAMRRGAADYLTKPIHYDEVRLDMPPLRERPSDVVVLAAHFLHKHAAENDKSVIGFGDDALAALARYPWPGNVRELENAIERAVIVCRSDTIRLTDLPPQTVAAGHASNAGLPPVPGTTLAALERYAILKTLEHTGGSTSRAAEILGISARKIQYRLRLYQTLDEHPPAGTLPRS